MIVVVDVANVLGSRPDGWWRDRAGAAGRLLDRLDALPGSTVDGPDGEPARVDRLIAVLEGAARSAATGRTAPVGPGHSIEVIEAQRDGDAAVVEFVDALGTEAGTETGTGVGTESGTGVGTESGTGVGTESGTRVGTGGPGPGDVLVVTADRGLRARLPAAVRTVGPNWLNGLIGR